MFIRRVKRKCGIRGCKNIDCFAISRAREIGNTVIMCRDCLKEALDSVDSLSPDAKTNVPETTQKTEAPPLFFSDVLFPKIDDAPSAARKNDAAKSKK